MSYVPMQPGNLIKSHDKCYISYSLDDRDIDKYSTQMADLRKGYLVLACIKRNGYELALVICDIGIGWIYGRSTNADILVQAT